MKFDYFQVGVVVAVAGLLMQQSGAQTLPLDQRESKLRQSIRPKQRQSLESVDQQLSRDELEFLDTSVKERVDSIDNALKLSNAHRKNDLVRPCTRPDLFIVKKTYLRYKTSIRDYLSFVENRTEFANASEDKLKANWDYLANEAMSNRGELTMLLGAKHMERLDTEILPAGSRLVSDFRKAHPYASGKRKSEAR
ncbi:MAG: hypothetical protein U0105_22560 [Candidatus Obscuribacterales bacterium]